MMKKQSKQVLALVLIFLGALAVFADRIVLKNGSVFEGIIESESPERIVLQIGSGTIGISRDSIQRVERAESGQNQRQADEWAAKEKREQELLTGPHAGLIAQYDKLISKHGAVQTIKRRLAQFEQNRVSFEKEQPVIMAEVDRLTKEVAELTRQINENPLPEKAPITYAEVRAYNRIVHQNSVLANQRAALQSTIQTQWARLGRKQVEIEQQSKQSKVERQAVVSYVQQLSDFSARFEKLKEAFQPENEAPEAVALYKDIAETLARYRGEIPTHHIPAEQRGNSTVVHALVNGKALGEFIFDTGASSMLLYESIARSMGIDPDSLSATEVVVADGSTVQGKRVILQTVKVGDAEVEEVSAVILPDSPNNSCDGLLGMSFLRHFMINMTAGNGEVELIRISP